MILLKWNEEVLHSYKINMWLVSLAFRALLFAPVLSFGNPVPATEWSYKFQGHEYTHFMSIANAFDAQQICEENRGYLASINSEDENYFVQNVIRAGGQAAWLGLFREGGAPPNCSDPCHEGWQWADGSLYNFTNWHTGEPSSYAHDSAFMTPDQAFWWGDPAGRARTFVCERAAESPIWTDKFLDHEYKVFNVYINASEAQKICEQNRGYLATINSEAENDFVQLMLRSAGHSARLGLLREGGPPPNCSDPCQEGFHWVDGSPYSFTKWRTGQPSSSSHDNFYMPPDQLFWWGTTVQSNRAFVCERDAESPPWSKRFLGQEYKLFKSKENITRAQQFCQEYGANLVTIHSEAENDFVQLIARDGWHDPWIGLYRDGGAPPDCPNPCREGWQWVDDSPVDYDRWRSNEPELARYDAAFMKGDVLFWFGDSQATKRPFICKRDAESTPWSNKFQGHEYKMFKIRVNAASAQQVCKNYGGYLASIGSEAENDFVQTVTQKEGEPAWLGLYRDGGEPPGCPTPCQEGWKWADGSPYGYEMWRPGEPSMPTFSGMFMLPGQNFWWGADIHSTRSFICERDVQCEVWPDMFEDSEYKLFMDGEKPYYAQHICMEHGGHLATMHSEAENNFVGTLASRTVNQAVWLGLYRDGGAPSGCPYPCRDGFQWVDGSPINYTHWTSQEPSSSDDYAIFMRYDVTVWFANPLRIIRPFVCERESQCTTWPDIFGGHEYKLFFEPAKPYQAQQICMEHGGHLATVHSEEENNFIGTLASRTLNSAVWLGLYRDGGAPPDCPYPCRDGFQWVDGSPVNFTHWTSQEPSRSDDYAIFMRYDVNVWFANPLRATRGFICERDVQCAPWTDVFGDHEYHLFMTEAKPHFAQQVCEEHGGYLATAHSEEENDFIASLAARTIDRTVWFGLYRDGGDPPGCPYPCREGWQWVDGSQVTYTKWRDNEPSSTDDYAAFMRYDISFWFADPLRVSRPFICERERCDRCYNSCSRSCSCTNN